MSFQEQLNRATDAIFAKRGTVVTNDHIAVIEEKVKAGMSTGTVITVTLDDENEFIDIKAVGPNGEKADNSLRFDDGRGGVYVHIDTDGDGK